MKRLKKLKRFILYTSVLAAAIVLPTAAWPADQGATEHTECFESREGYTKIGVEEVEPGWPNVKCSDRTGGVLWWGDPYAGTQPMGEMEIEADYSHEEAVVRPRTEQLNYYMPCTVCHNGATVPYPKSKFPRPLMMHQDIVADAMDLQHGRGQIWCLDCHNPKNRDTLIDHMGREISFNQPQKLCGKCHGQIYQDWRDGIHGKRTGQWRPGEKKRWWVCTECHNPHTVQADRFNPLQPEPAPHLPKGMTSADHENLHGGGDHGGGSSGSGHDSSSSSHGSGH